MPLDVIVGVQWGDEGKGKVVDLYADHADAVVRYGGGANAGHTMYIRGKKYVTHLLPSGLLRGKPCVLGAGMVIDPEQLLAEIDEFGKMGFDVSPERIMISPEAHIILPTHKALDEAQEAMKGGGAIGTTKRGIGPAYADKVYRVGLRAEEMLRPMRFGMDVENLVRRHNRELVSLGANRSWLGDNELKYADKVGEQYREYANKLSAYLVDTSVYLHGYLEAGKVVLAEGAQGTLLDIDHGGYPYVTSSSIVAGSAAVSLGVSPKYIDRIIGVAKCFQTRVGYGPMPTEISRNTTVFQHLRGERGQPGAEFGATTGRERRVGWLDLVLLRYAARINGCTELALTKLDVLSGLDEIRICTGYEMAGRVYREGELSLPLDWVANLGDFTPHYETLSGWRDNIEGMHNFDELPENAWSFIKRIEEVVRVPVSMVSVGVDRNQVIVR